MSKNNILFCSSVKDWTDSTDSSHCEEIVVYLESAREVIEMSPAVDLGLYDLFAEEEQCIGKVFLYMKSSFVHRLLEAALAILSQLQNW